MLDSNKNVEKIGTANIFKFKKFNTVFKYGDEIKNIILDFENKQNLLKYDGDSIPIYWSHVDTSTLDPENHSKIGLIKNLRTVNEYIVGDYDFTEIDERKWNVIKEQYSNKGAIDFSIELDTPNINYKKKDFSENDIFEPSLIPLIGVAIVRQGAASTIDGVGIFTNEIKNTFIEIYKQKEIIKDEKTKNTPSIINNILEKDNIGVYKMEDIIKNEIKTNPLPIQSTPPINNEHKGEEIQNKPSIDEIINGMESKINKLNDSLVKIDSVVGEIVKQKKIVEEKKEPSPPSLSEEDKKMIDEAKTIKSAWKKERIDFLEKCGNFSKAELESFSDSDIKIAINTINKMDNKNIHSENSIPESVKLDSKQKPGIYIHQFSEKEHVTFFNFDEMSVEKIPTFAKNDFDHSLMINPDDINKITGHKLPFNALSFKT